MPETVLVVDDESMIRDLYATWLGVDYDVRTAGDGEEALSVVDDGVDVVLLDRRMPGMHGDEVLERIRERALDCRVVMASAVDPREDILELPFDDYLVKPAEREDLLAAVEAVLARERYDPTARQYLSTVAKLGVLESNHSTAGTETLTALRERLAELRGDVEADDWLDDRSAHEELVVEVPAELSAGT
jgi:DNA-binding response OmpR family regulator